MSCAGILAEATYHRSATSVLKAHPKLYPHEGRNSNCLLSFLGSTNWWFPAGVLARSVIAASRGKFGLRCRVLAGVWWVELRASRKSYQLRPRTSVSPSLQTPENVWCNLSPILHNACLLHALRREDVWSQDHQVGP